MFPHPSPPSPSSTASSRWAIGSIDLTYLNIFSVILLATLSGGGVEYEHGMSLFNMPNLQEVATQDSLMDLAWRPDMNLREACGLSNGIRVIILILKQIFMCHMSRSCESSQVLRLSNDDKWMIKEIIGEGFSLTLLWSVDSKLFESETHIGTISSLYAGLRWLTKINFLTYL
jgi:hypothetical protein